MGFPSMDLINTTYCTQMTKTSTTSLATRGPSSWDTGQANHYCLEGLPGEAEEGLGLQEGAVVANSAKKHQYIVS